MNTEIEYKKCEVVMVVDGHPFTIPTDTHVPLTMLKDAALRVSRNQRNDPGDWELRTSDGVLLKSNWPDTTRLGQVKFESKLFLNPKPGTGREVLAA